MHKINKSRKENTQRTSVCVYNMQKVVSTL